MPQPTYLPPPYEISHQPGVVVRSSHALRLWLSFLLAIMSLAPGTLSAAPAQTPATVAAPRITLAIFSDRPMPEQLWPMLVGALQQEISEEAPDLPAVAGANADGSLEIVRGDAIRPGIVVDKAITVFVHGECMSTPPRTRLPVGQRVGPGVPSVLGWVNMEHHQIAPFIHVECTHIGQALWMQGIGSNASERNQQMATAMARVILHEWIHIATQNSHHAKKGIFKAQLDESDLVAQQSKPTTPQQAAPIEGGR